MTILVFAGNYQEYKLWLEKNAPTKAEQKNIFYMSSYEQTLGHDPKTTYIATTGTWRKLKWAEDAVERILKIKEIEK